MLFLKKGNDIDIGVYADPNRASNSLSVDLKIEMHRQTGLPPETFDVRLLGEVIEQGDVFGLLYLKVSSMTVKFLWTRIRTSGLPFSNAMACASANAKGSCRRLWRESRSC
jgi:hypothetical protein